MCCWRPPPFIPWLSLPVALHYLDPKRFGLWVVMGTLMGYLGLIDAGMTVVRRKLPEPSQN